MHKRIVSLGLSLTIAANIVPSNLVEAFADEVAPIEVAESVEVNREESVQGITESEELSEEDTSKEIESENVIEDVDSESEYGVNPQSTEMTRTATVNVKVENGQYGEITGLNEDNKVILNSKYENVTSSGNKLNTTYKGTLVENDEPVTIVVTPKEGYEFDTTQLAIIDATNDHISVAKDSTTGVVTITISSLTSDSWKNILGVNDTNRSANVTVKFTKKSNAQQITTVVEGEGDIELDSLEDLVYENGAYIINNGSTHTFNIKPAEGMEIKSVTLNDEPVEVVKGQVTVGAGELKAVFGEVAEETFDLDLSVKGQGNVVIANQNISGDTSSTIALNKGEKYNFTVKPADGYYVSSVKLDGKEITEYKIEDIDAAHTLEVVFVEKLETKIEFGDLKVAWDGTEKQLSYKIVDNNGVVLKSENVTFKKKNFLGIWQTFNPKDVGVYDFTVTYDGDDTHKPVSESGIFEIYDARKDINIEFTNLTAVYNGTVQYPTAVIKDSETNEIIENLDITIKYDFDLDITKTKGKDVGAYSFTATFDGDENYSATSTKETFEITKCTPKVSVANKQVEYNGEAVSLPVTVAPDCGYITVYTGINANLGTKVYVDLNLGNDIISKTIKNLLSGASLGTVGDLANIIEKNETLLSSLGVDASQILKVLKIVPQDMGLGLGSPNQPGAFLATAIVLDNNANTTVGVGTLLIVRQTKKVEFTEESLANGSYVKYGTDYNHEAYYEGTTSKTKMMYTGITAKGELYFSATKPTDLGTYAALAYSYDDLEYKTALAARTFTIGKYISTLSVTSTNKTYDGMPYEPSVIVKDLHGNVIEGATAEYTYYKNGKKLSSAPTDAGKYLVVAKYKSTNEYFLSMNSKYIEIAKADVTIKVNNATKNQGQTDPEFTYEIDGLAKNDLKVTLLREVGENIGTYIISATYENNTNYNVKVVNGLLTIHEAPTLPAEPSEPEQPSQPEAPDTSIDGAEVEGGDATVDSPYAIVVNTDKGLENILKSIKEDGYTYEVVGDKVEDGDYYIYTLKIYTNALSRTNEAYYYISLKVKKDDTILVELIENTIDYKDTIKPSEPETPEIPETPEVDGDDDTTDGDEDTGNDDDNTNDDNQDNDKVEGDDNTNGGNQEDDKVDNDDSSNDDNKVDTDGDNSTDKDNTGNDNNQNQDSDKDNNQNNNEDKKPSTDKNDDSVKTFDAGIGSSLGMGLAALGGLFVARRRKNK